MEDINWVERKGVNVRLFQLQEEPEVLYFIHLGNGDRYIVIKDDAYQITTGNSEVLYSEQIKEKYGIDLSKRLDE